MSIGDYVIRTIDMSITCTVCGNEKHIYNETRGKATGLLIQAGWIESDTDIICPACIKQGKL